MESSPEEFISKYFFNFFKIENKSWNYKLNIHLSLFLNIYFWTVNLHDYKEKQGWVVVGIRTYKFFYQKEAFEKVDRFLKVLGDKRRVDIVKMLSHKPYYGYEIAAKLELTPATVNYHINLLMDAGILTFDREENKVYYTLNKDRVKELLNETSMMLINEPLK
nr:metalloregulator ArsR/SmtB family transcription factor [Clostridium rhizosphaerae]